MEGNKVRRGPVSDKADKDYSREGHRHFTLDIKMGTFFQRPTETFHISPALFVYA